jgi:anti-sigma factor RsiW
MDCVEFIKLMSSYLDGELEEPLQAEGANHLAGCPDCCAELVEWQTCLDWLRKSLPEQVPPPRLWDEMRTKIERGKK